MAVILDRITANGVHVQVVDDNCPGMTWEQLVEGWKRDPRLRQVMDRIALKAAEAAAREGARQGD